jgi:DNA-binding CsgD family transcriptional regulator
MRQMPHGLSDLLLRLYRLAREGQAPVFKEQAFALVKQYLPFESGLWGAMTVFAPDRTHVHWVFLDRQSMAMIENWQKYSAHDPSHAEAIAALGRTIIVNLSSPKEAARYHPKLIEHAHTYDICHSLSMVTHDPVLNLRNAISFYRGWSGKKYTEAERRFADELMPHLMEAWNICAIRYVHAGDEAEATIARAVTDRAGSIHNVEHGFTDLVRAEFPDWTGPVLPAAFVGAHAGLHDETFRGREIVVNTLRLMDDGMRVLGIRRLNAGSKLTPRELTVAREFASGRTYTEIAGHLGVAPKTVRNQLQSVYAKLGVKTKLALVKRLQSE